jgi:hypothetical protein
LVQKYLKSEQEKQQQIEEQQQEIGRLSQGIARSESGSCSVDDIARLELEIDRLKTQVTKCQTSQQLEKKCEQLTAMLDKSRDLYAQLSERHRKLAAKYESKRFRLRVDRAGIFERVLPQAKGENVTEAMLASLKKTVLQYFLTDSTNQENLMPVILELVGCNPEQIQIAVRNFKSNQQFVNRAGGIFSLFG